MESTFESGRDRGVEDSEAGTCDITSFIFHLHGQHGFDITIQRRFIPPTPNKLDAIPPLELPGPALSDFSSIGIDEDSIHRELGGLGAAFSSGIRKSTENSAAAPSQAKEINADLEHVPNVTIRSNSGFKIDFSVQIGKCPLQIVPEQQSENYGTALQGSFLNGFEETISNGGFNVNEPGQTTDFSQGFGANPDFLPFSQDMAFSSSNLNYTYDAEASSTKSPVMGFDANDIICSDIAPTHSSESSFSSASSNLTSPSPSPIIITSAPEGNFCRLCHLTFKRSGDLKRHEGIHFPEQRKFHCKQAGCERRGRKAFYRRDKLRIHERSVHGLCD